MCIFSGMYAGGSGGLFRFLDMLRLLSAVVKEITRFRTFPLPFFIIIIMLLLPFPDDCTSAVVDDVTLGWSDVAVDGAEREGDGKQCNFMIKNVHKSTINYYE